ncbi:tandem-95 repeat protein [Dyella flagellata]|uniref:Tandem-95 repeat protein n=1 Tax=Dyella flagellata TaxID=1867833 RepID=A0ABQ5XE26_9GAMM|nr:hypothetical protein GCM10007898_30490 [Dyella flagellata]
MLPPKRPPIANDVTISVPSEKPSSIDLLANASDPDGQALTAHIVDGPSHGCLHRNEDGNYTYVPQDEWFGDDSFSYDVNDSEAQSNIAIVHIKVVPMPTAENAQFRVDSDGTVRIDLRCLVDDPDENAEAKLVISVKAPGHGQLIHKDDGVYHYKPDQGFSGVDTFTYTVSDGINSASATITLDVRHDDDDDDGCWSSRTIIVSAKTQGNDDEDQGNGYIIINRHSREDIDDEGSASQLDWSGSSDTDFGVTTAADGNWWGTLFNDAMLGVADLSKQSGLVVKRMD